jgi:hypothetical protein
LLLNGTGQAGLIATNTIAQGDTRTVGLDQVVKDGVEIRCAVKSEPWPSSSAALEYSAVWTSKKRLDPCSQRVADGRVVAGITTSLDPVRRISGNPYHLASNQGIAYQGFNILGIGFIVNTERARGLLDIDPRNAHVLFPYLNGQDLNSRPDCSASRWVINFHDWTEEKASSYPECYRQVKDLVKPERSLNKVRSRREKW